MLLAHHANGWMCIANTVFFILILPDSSESYVQHPIVTKPVELGHSEGKLSSVPVNEESTGANSDKVV